MKRSRREFLGDSLSVSTGLMAAAMLGMAGSEAEADAYRGPILSCETYSLRDLIAQGKQTLETIPALLKDLNIKGISLNDLYFPAWDTDYLDHLKEACRKNGRIITCLIMEGNLAANDPAARTQQIAEDTRKLKVAAYLGAPVVRMNLGGTGNDDEDKTVGVERCIAAFKQMLPLAKKLNIKITIENHGGVSLTADRILRVINGTDPKWVGSCLDFGNWPDNPPELRYQSCQLLAPHAYHVHAKTRAFNADGDEADMDYTRLLGMIKAAHYKRAVSIEWEGGNPADPIKAVEMSRDMILRHWPQLT